MEMETAAQLQPVAAGPAPTVTYSIVGSAGVYMPATNATGNHPASFNAPTFSSPASKLGNASSSSTGMAGAAVSNLLMTFLSKANELFLDGHSGIRYEHESILVARASDQSTGLSS